MNSAPVPGFGRRVVAAVWAAVATPYLLLALVVPIARAAGLFANVSVPAVAVLGAVAGPLIVASRPGVASPLPKSLDRWFDAGNRRIGALWTVGSLLAVLGVGRIAVFLGDPNLVGFSFMPSVPFLVRHSCLTAYMHGAILSLDPAANVYDLAFVGESADAPTSLPPTAANFAPFNLDAFGYPPPFLLLARSLRWLTQDFMSERIIVGAVSIALILVACAAVAKTLGGVAERRIWLLTPLFVGHPLTLLGLQVGNFHLAAVALCTLCWVTVERRKDGAAGVLLAVATLAKIFPGLLGILLLAQRRWRAAGMAALWGVALIALSVGVLGTKVWADFLFYHLPKVQSGEALRFMVGTTREIAANVAPFGIPFKLAAMGLAGWGWPQARILGNLYTVALVVLAAVAGRNTGRPQHRLSVWLAMVMLASLRSPYAAVFVLATLFLLLLVIASELHSRGSVAALVALAVFFSVPTPSSDPKAMIAVSLLRMGVLGAFLVWVVIAQSARTKETHSQAARDAKRKKGE